MAARQSAWPARSFRIPGARAYAGALILTAASAGIGYLLVPFLNDDAPYPPLVMAVLGSSLIGGLACGLVSTVASAAAATWILSVTGVHPSALDGPALFRMVAFLTTGLVISLAGYMLERFRDSAARELRRAEELGERLQVAQEAAGAGTWDWGFSETPAYWSPALCTLLGFDEPPTFEAFLGRVHSADRSSLERAITRARRTGELRVEYRLSHPAAGERWLLTVARAVTRTSDGAPVLSGVVLDITDRREAELRERESREQIRTMADAVPQIVWSTLANGEADYFNERWYEYTGMPRTDDVSWGWADYLHPDDRALIVERWRENVARGAAWDVTYRLQRGRDGSYRWFLARGLPVRNAEGEITRWFGTCTDIHEDRQRTEEREALLASERSARSEAERAIRQRDEFVSVLSHELRTPLNAILGWAQILRTQSHDPEAIGEAVAVIERNVRAQAQLISDLFDITRITAGRISLDIQPVDAATVVDAAIDSLRPAISAKELELETTVGGDTHCRADPMRLQQIVWNLISNAVKFTPRQGRIAVTVERKARSLEIGVSDTGEGIAPEFLPYVFQRYSQADSSSRRPHGGLGLGLSISKHLAELHGGQIDVSSQGLGRGASVRVSLPAAVRH